MVFPCEAERVILGEEVKEAMTFENKADSEENERTAKFFDSYIDELASRMEGEIRIITWLND